MLQSSLNNCAEVGLLCVCSGWLLSPILTHIAFGSSIKTHDTSVGVVLINKEEIDKEEGGGGSYETSGWHTSTISGPSEADVLFFCWCWRRKERIKRKHCLTFMWKCSPLWRAPKRNREKQKLVRRFIESVESFEQTSENTGGYWCPFLVNQNLIHILSSSIDSELQVWHISCISCVWKRSLRSHDVNAQLSTEHKKWITPSQRSPSCP